MAFPTYTADATTSLTAVEHLDGVAHVYTFPYTPVSQEEAWIFEKLYELYGPRLHTFTSLTTSPTVQTVSGQLTRVGG